MKSLKLASSDNLKQFLEVLVEESVRKSIFDTGIEKSRQEKMQKSLTQWPLKAGKVNEKEAEVEEDTETIDVDVSSVEDPEDEEKGKMKVNLEQVVSHLNTIRSGRSLRHKDVNAELDEYFNKLSTPQKVALIKFLEGLSQIVAGGIDGDRAVDPDDEPDPVKISSEEESAPPEDVETEEEIESEITPPIKVSKESQDVLRRNIRNLLYR